MTSLETLLAAANFVEANDRPVDLARENALPPGATDIHLSVFASQLGQVSAVRDVSDSRNAEESKAGEGGSHSASNCFTGTGSTRQVHKRLEKNRRAVLKDCFEGLKKQIPTFEDRRNSHLHVLRMAVKYVQTLKVKSKELERSRTRLQQQNSSLQQRLVALQLNDASVAPPTSPSTDTADDSPFVSDDEPNITNSASSHRHDIIHAQADGIVAHSGILTSAPPAGSGTATSGSIMAMLSVQPEGAEVMQRKETALAPTGRHTGTKHMYTSVSRSLTIAELTGSRQPLASQSNDAGHQSASGTVCSSSNFSHSLDSKVRSGPRHGRTVVQMLQNSLMQKALNHEVATSSNISNCIKVADGQTDCATLPTSTAAAAGSVELMSSTQLSPGVLMSAAAAGGIVLTLDHQQVKDVGHLVMASPAQQLQCAAATSSFSSSQQMSSVLSPTVSQLVLCPAPAVPYQSAPLTIAAARTMSPSNAAAQFCTVLGSVTSVPLLQVPAVVQSVQLMPAAVGVPVSPVFVAGDISGASSLFMVPN